MSNALLSHAIDKLHAMRSSSSIHCKVCCAEADPFDVVDFNKSCNHTSYPMGLSGIPVIYWQCRQCQFIFTDLFDQFSAEQWRRHIYNEDYAKVDPDYLDTRPRATAHQLQAFLVGRKDTIIGLDYGGGNGLTAALLREQGWTFDSYDPFGRTEMASDRIGHYNFCSAMEVFEHLHDPVGSLQAIIEKTNRNRVTIMIGTSIHDGRVSKESRLSWWYAAPRNGHVSLYSRKSLQILGNNFGLTYSSVSRGTHLLTRGMSHNEARIRLLRGKLLWRLGLAPAILSNRT